MTVFDSPDVEEDVLSSVSRHLPPSDDNLIYRVEGTQVYGMDDTLSNFSDKEKRKGIFKII